MSETFFVTGATGFIGARLVARLAESGKRVKCLTRSRLRRKSISKYDVDFVEGDLNDVEALRRGVSESTCVFHLAGLTRESRRGEFDAVNRVGLLNVVRVCAEVSPKPVLISVSSLSGAGVAPKSADSSTYAPYRLKRETDFPKPVSPYGRSKFAGELELTKFADAVPISVVRPPYVFGEGDLHSAPLYRMAKEKGVFVIPGWVDRFYSFVYVEDLVEVLIKAFERGERLTSTSLTPFDATPSECSGCGIYYATSHDPVRFSDFGAMIGRAYGRNRLTTFRVPPVGVLGAGIYGECYRMATHKLASLDWNKSIEALRGPWICSGEKSASQLGVTVGSSLEEKIKRAADWYYRENIDV